MTVKSVLRNEYDEHAAEALARECGIRRPLAVLLSERGIDTPEKVAKFINPSPDDLIDPYSLCGMREAADRITQAVGNDERVLVYGDYDCDGLTAVAMLYSYLAKKITHVSYYVPNRHSDGYGLHDIVVSDFVKKENIDLVITADCGVTSKKETEIIRAMGIDVVITDHHEPIPDLIPDTIVLNPKIDRKSFSDYCGAGVVFKLIEALSGREEAMSYAAVAAIGTIADIVPLVGENRIIAKAGLDMMNGKTVPFANEMAKRLNKNEITSTDVMFRIAPRINALGRLSDATPVVELFTSSDEKVINGILDKLDEVNKERQILCESVVNDIMKKLSDFDLENNLAIIMKDDSWNIGVLGIAASKLAETFNRPVILFTESDGLYKGSARSNAKINIFECLSAVKDCLYAYGGHSAAAGVSVTKEGFDDFVYALNDYLKSNFDREAFMPEIVYDLDADVFKDFESVDELRLLEPCGFRNPEPVFLCERNLCFRQIGNTPHLKAVEGDFEFVAFNSAKRSREYLSRNGYVVGLENKSFRSHRYTQALIKNSFVESTGNYPDELLAFESLNVEDVFCTEKTDVERIDATEIPLPDGIFGNLYVAYDKKTYDNFLARCDKRNMFVIRAINNAYSLNPYNTAVLAPENDFGFKYFNRVYFLDEPYTEGTYARIKKESRARIFVAGERSSAEKIRSYRCKSDDEYREIYKYLFRTQVMGAQNYDGLILKLLSTDGRISPFKVLSTFFISKELGIIKERAGGGFVFDNTVKKDLKLSKIHNLIENI